jgi:hypothetical protein
MDAKRKRGGRKVGGPTLDEFHIILQQLQGPDKKIKFTDSAVVGLRQAYFVFMQQVASSLSQWDSLKDESAVVEALGMNNTSDFEQWTQQAQELLSKKQANTKPPAKRKKKRPRLSAAEQERLEAEQNRLLQQSKQTVLDQQQQQK